MSVDPDQLVRLNLVSEISHFCGEDGQWCDVEIDDAGRYIMIAAGLAHAMLCTGQPSSFPLREANAALVAALGPLKPEPGVSIVRYWEAQREAMTPPSRNEIITETLQMYERAMR